MISASYHIVTIIKERFVVIGNEVENKKYKSLTKTKQRKVTSIMNIEKELDDIKNSKINSLPMNKAFKVSLFLSEFCEMEFLPSSFVLKRIGKNLLEISSEDDWINDIMFLLQDIEHSPLLRMESRSRVLKSMIKAIKKYSEGKYQIHIEDGEHFFNYTFVLSGSTVGDVFNKIVKMYEEVASEDSCTNSDLRKELIGE